MMIAAGQPATGIRRIGVNYSGKPKDLSIVAKSFGSSRVYLPLFPLRGF
jgi:hypothetical protein